MPLLGNVTAVVKPSARTDSSRLSDGFTRSAALTQLVVNGRSSGPLAGGGAGVAGCAGCGAAPRAPPVVGAASGIPNVLSASIRPGYTVNPSPSMIQASAGAVTSAPTASINPSRNTTVPLGITGPFTGTTRALRIAMAPGGAANIAPAITESKNTSRFIGNRLLW